MDVFKGVEADITLEMSLQKPRVGLLGGAFDPPHLAHRALAEAAITALTLSPVKLIRHLFGVLILFLIVGLVLLVLILLLGFYTFANAKKFKSQWTE